MIEGESVYKTNDREESYDDYSCGDVNESGGINKGRFPVLKSV